MSKLTLQCVGWKPLRRNTLVGFAEIRVAAMRLTIADVAIHDKGTARWAALPAKPQMRDGVLVRDDAGKGQYVQLFEFDNGEVRNAFSRAAIAAVLELHPDVFDEQAVSA